MQARMVRCRNLLTSLGLASLLLLLTNLLLVRVTNNKANLSSDALYPAVPAAQVQRTTNIRTEQMQPLSTKSVTGPPSAPPPAQPSAPPPAPPSAPPPAPPPHRDSYVPAVAALLAGRLTAPASVTPLCPACPNLALIAINLSQNSTELSQHFRRALSNTLGHQTLARQTH